MPIHDWTRVDAGLFHDFHQGWISALCDAFNLGGLPSNYFALIEKPIKRAVEDFLILSLSPAVEAADNDTVALSAAVIPPRTRLVRRSESAIYADKADRITVRHRHGDIVAVIEIVSPGNKASRAELRAFVEKTTDLIRQKVHLLVIDLFPPGPRDPWDIHKAIWDEFEDEDFELPPDKPLVLAAYDAGPEQAAYVDSVAVGDTLPEMPLFLEPGFYVPAPLEATYQTTWNAFPVVLKGLLEGPGS